MPEKKQENFQRRVRKRNLPNQILNILEGTTLTHYCIYAGKSQRQKRTKGKTQVYMNCRYTEEFSDLYKLYPENPQASITRKKENDSVI